MELSSICDKSRTERIWTFKFKLLTCFIDDVDLNHTYPDLHNQWGTTSSHWMHSLVIFSISNSKFLQFLPCFIQREAVEALIQELPKFRLKAVPTDCSECPICLEEFHVGNEVRVSFSHWMSMQHIFNLGNAISMNYVYLKAFSRPFRTAILSVGLDITPYLSCRDPILTIP